MPYTNGNKDKDLDKCIDFLKQDFAATIRSRKGSLSEMATLLRFQPGTKGFHRRYEYLLGKAKQLGEAYSNAVLGFLSKKGIRIGIIDDSSVKKTGKQFPKQQVHHDHSSNSFYSGMKMLSTSIYQYGKLATISSKLVGEDDNKLDVAKEKIDLLINNFLVDIVVFDSWYCKGPVIERILEHKALFISRLRRDSKVILNDEAKMRLDLLIKQIPHSEYIHIKIHGKSYWLYEIVLDFASYGIQRIIVSKEGQYEKPIFLITNAENFSAKFIVKLYLRRFSIEVFFKDAKQFLNLESFFCRLEEKWNLHLLLTNILHWCTQKKNSISKTVRPIREDIKECLLFINENSLFAKFADGFRRICQT